VTMRTTLNVPKIVFMSLALLIIGAAQAIADGLPPEANTITWSSDKRFTDNKDQTITDTKTGLMWAKMDSYLHTGHWISWNESNKYIADLNEKRFCWVL